MANIKFRDLASMVAEDFNKTMAKEGFETFKEMKECYDWEWKDIKDEVEYMINKQFEGHGFMMMDDYSVARIDKIDFTDEFAWECSWREFKKMFMSMVH
jgi:hypothetical protein